MKKDIDNIKKLLISLQEDEEDISEVKEKLKYKEDVTNEYIFENVKTYEEFCKITDLKCWNLKDFDHFSNPKKICAQEKLNQIEIFFNKDNELAWEKMDQKKYYIYFDVDHLGNLKNGRISDISSNFYTFSIQLTNRKTAEYVRTTFVDIFQDLL